MFVEQMQVGPMAVFAYIVACETEKKALLIDPAGNEKGLLSRAWMSLGFSLKYVVNTHTHADHTCGNRGILSRTKARAGGPRSGCESNDKRQKQGLYSGPWQKAITRGGSEGKRW